MGRQSGFLQRQAEYQEDLSLKIQMITRQFMVDTVQIVLHQKFGWGYDRLTQLHEAWEETRKELHAAIDPKDPLCDVTQEHIERAFEQICKGRDRPLWDERYPYLKEVRYARRK